MDGEDGADGWSIPGLRGQPATPGATSYGEMVIENGVTGLVLTTINVFYQITAGWAAGDLNGVTYASGALTVQNSGAYFMTASVSLNSTSSNQIYSIQIFQNGVAIPGHDAEIKLTNNTDVNSLTIAGLRTTVNAGDVFTLWAQNQSSGGQTLLVTDANFSIFAVSGATGATGASGSTGPDGQDGEDAWFGPQGNQGIQGIPGTNGLTVVGQDGQDGEDAWLGPQGNQGVPGTPGSSGINGLTGAVGQDGQDGEDAWFGPQGNPGVNGIIGVNGATGAVGQDGQDGEDAWFGPQGNPGVNGTIGVNGAMGSPGQDGQDGEEGSIWLVTPPSTGGAGVPATTVVSGTTPGLSPIVGVLTSYAREDHSHGTPAAGASGPWTIVQNSTLVTDTLTVTAGYQFLCGRTFNNVGAIINNGDFIITH
jgi:hypothetical protein